MKDFAGCFEKAEKAIALSITRVDHSITDMISKAEQKAVPVEERMALLLEQLKSFNELQCLKSVWKRSIRQCKCEVSALNRGIINFIKVNLDANSTSLDELLGLHDTSMNSFGGEL